MKPLSEMTSAEVTTELKRIAAELHESLDKMAAKILALQKSFGTEEADASPWVCNRITSETVHSKAVDTAMKAPKQQPQCRARVPTYWSTLPWRQCDSVFVNGDGFCEIHSDPRFQRCECGLMSFHLPCQHCRMKTEAKQA